MKKYLLGLLVGFVSLISFCSATEVVGLADITPISSTSVNNSTWTTIVDMGGDNIVDGNRVMCVSLQFDGMTTYIGFADTPNGNAGGEVLIWKNWNGSYICLNRGTNGYYLKAKSDSYSRDTVYGNYFFLDELLDTEIPVLTSLECQSEYNLISVSDVDQNYCVNNNLCPYFYLHINESNGDTESSLINHDVDLNIGTGILIDSSASPVGDFYFSVDPDGGSCELGSGNWSALYINGIQHESAGLIDINIADYVPWDYSINNDVFDLDVGSGYDQDYIDGVIDVQSYRPTSEDFTQTFVGGLILFTPYVVILLFVILVWNLIKKIFRSK